MEFNITRQSVSANHICLSKNLEHNLDFDVNLPDYCAAVHRILKTELKPYVASKNLNGRTLTIEGTANYSVLYVDDSNKIHCFEHTVPFAKSLEIDTDAGDCSFSVCAKCGYFNSKALSPRRLEAHAVIAFQIKGECKKATEIISDIDNCDIYFYRGETPATTPVNYTEKNIIIEEELEIGTSQPYICDVLRYNVVPCLEGYKIVNDKIVVKGNLNIYVLYSADDHCTSEKFKDKVNFSQIVDIPGINENCECDIYFDLISASVKPRSSFDGDSKTFILNAKICVCVNTVCENAIPIVLDAYSSKVALEVGYDNILCCKTVDKISEKYSCKKQLEFSDGDIHNIIDLWCNTAVCGHRFEDDNLVISGTATVCIISENLEKSINYFERPVDFECRCQTAVSADTAVCEPRIFVNDCSFEMNGENSLNVSVELNISANVQVINSYDAVIDIKESADAKFDKNSDFAMMIYFADAGEKIWEIAKLYKASPEEIMQINSVSDVLCEKTTLLIPC